MEDDNIIKISLINNSFLSVRSNAEVEYDISEHFSLFVDGYKYMPAYKNEVWDGKKRLFNWRDKLLPAGLYTELKSFADSKGYKIVNNTPFEDLNEIDLDDLFTFMKSLNINIRGNQINYTDYRFRCQFKAIYKALKNSRCILSCPTGLGKSLIIYCLIRYWQRYIKVGNEKCLIVVPNVQLVDQMYGDFLDYSDHDDTWDVADEVHKISAGAERDGIEQDIIVSTWQSIYKLDASWFEPITMIIGDEVHKFKSESLVSIMDKSVNAPYRIGTTGTVGKSKTNIMILQGTIGQVFKITNTATLQEENILAALLIDIIKFKYPTRFKSEFQKSRKIKTKRATYQDEVNWLVACKERNEMIKNLALSLEGNTLVMFNLVGKHGKPLYELIKGSAECKVFYISGEINKRDRESIRKIVESQEKSIIVASMATFAEGINIRNLHNIILTHPTKSEIRVLQSIGRVLRISDNKETSKLYDIVDDLSVSPSRPNHSLKHGQARIEYYDQEGFKYKTHEVHIR